ncbi:MAG: hypothetical protein ACKVHP_04465 [Verrucomicrobiales bacterium]
MRPNATAFEPSFNVCSALTGECWAKLAVKETAVTNKINEINFIETIYLLIRPPKQAFQSLTEG